MAKTYNYSLKELRELLKLLKTYEHASLEIDEDIANLTHFINYLYPNKRKTKIDLKDYFSIPTLIKKDIKRFAYFKPYIPLIEEFAHTGASIKDLAIDPTYKEIVIPNKIAVLDATDFLSHHGSFFQEPLTEFSQDIQSHLKFLKQDLNISGGTLYIKSTGDAFVYAPDRHDITKLAILTHELEHVIDFYNNSKMYDNYITREVLPVFMEIIATFFFAQKYDAKEDAKKRTLYLYTIIKEKALAFVEKMKLLNIAEQNQNLSNPNLHKLLEDKGYSEEQLIYFINFEIQDFFYQIPELIAIELFFLYQEDKNKVLSILEDIVIHGNDINLLNLIKSHNIKLTKNTQNFETLLLQKTKR